MKYSQMCILAFGLLVAVFMAGCSTTGEEAVRIEYVEVFRETQRPCPAEAPGRPGPLARPLPEDTGRLVDALTAKLLEWSGPAGYADQAEAVIQKCTEVEEPQ